MRLFVAINFDEKIKEYLMEKVTELRKYSVSGNFTRRENFHLTLAFIGETDKQKEVEAAIDVAVNKSYAHVFPVGIGGIGKFMRREGDIYWVGVKKDTMLWEINRNLMAELRGKGFDIDEQEFKPHLTIGRRVIVDNFDAEGFGDTENAMEMLVKRISLMKSERINGKLTYTEVYGVQLKE